MNRTTIKTILDSIEDIEYKSFVQGLHRADHDLDSTFFRLQRYIRNEKEYIKELLERGL